jgi:hypothetical protein
MGESEGDGMRHLWVVEMLDNDKWYSTVGVSLERDVGRDELKTWREKCPDDKFRLMKYIPSGVRG